MSKNAIAFLAGLGTGYVNQSEKNKDRERQDKKDTQDTEIFNAKMSEFRDGQKLKQGFADNAATRTAIEGTAVDTGNGKNLYTDPAQAAAAVDDARIEAEMRGQDPAKVTSMAAHGITGKMATGNQITTGPVDLAQLNSPAAIQQRNVATLYGAGKPMEAMQLEASAMAAKNNVMTQAKLQREETREIANNLVMQGFQKNGGDAFKLAATMGTQAGGPLEGTTVEDRISADGKTRSIVGIKEGVEKVFMTASNDEAGNQQVLQRLQQVDAKTIIDWGFKNREEIRTVKKDEQTQSNFERTEGRADKALNLTASHQKVMEGLGKGNLSVSQMNATLAQARNTREQAAFDSESKIPQAEKTQLASLTKHMDIMEKAMSDAKAKGEWQPENAGAKELMRDYKAASDKYTKIITPFMGASKKAAGPGADPLGLNVPAAVAGTPPPPVARPVIPAPAAAPVAAAAGMPDGNQPPPTMQQTQEFFRAKQAQIAAGNEKLKADPRIPKLLSQKDDAIRRGKPIEANGYLAEIDRIKTSYGL